MTLHNYLYVHADPVNNIDPSGNITLSGLMGAINIRGQLGTLSTASAQSALNRLLVGNVTRTTAGGTVSSGNYVGLIGNMVVQEAEKRY